ncbi:MAG TPA: tetratricopeptide repeat protein [Gemmatimonadaceae bacterium]|nr:tetratricopeptide repeat protein [Gemmatimonadaceae bacterium]
MLTLQLFGGCALLSNGEPVTGPPAQRRRLALLALLASSPGGSSRDKLVAFFWPDDDRDRARHFLADSVFTLRKSLGKDAVLTTGDDVRLNPSVIASDVARFEELAAAGELADALGLYRGPFLDGFFIDDAPEFERWVERERDRLARRVGWCLEQLATGHESAGEWASAAEVWRRLAAHDPYNSRVALRAMQALDACGDCAGALQHARVHQARVHDELGLESDRAVVELAESLRTRSTTRVAGNAPAAKRVARTPRADSRPTPVWPVARKGRATRRSRLTLPAVVAAVTAALAAAVFLLERAKPAREMTTDSATSRTTFVASGDVPRPNGGAGTAEVEARDLYARGRYVLTKGQFDPDIHRRALELFGQAAAHDSSFAPAYAGMADVYNHADDPIRAKDAALRAIALDPSIAEAHTALAYVLAFYEYRWADADSELRRAIALDPRYVLAHLRLANVLAAQGRLAEAEAAVERAREIQPESFVVMLNRGMMAEMSGRYEEAIARYQDALVLEPGRIDARHMLVRAYWAQGKYAEAQGVMRAMGSMAGVVAMSGNPDTMSRIAPLLAASSNVDSLSLAAEMYVRLGRKDNAMQQLERLYERRHKHLALLVQQQPFVPLRDYPPFVALVRKLNLPMPATR